MEVSHSLHDWAFVESEDAMIFSHDAEKPRCRETSMQQADGALRAAAMAKAEANAKGVVGVALASWRSATEAKQAKSRSPRNSRCIVRQAPKHGWSASHVAAASLGVALSLVAATMASSSWLAFEVASTLPMSPAPTALGTIQSALGAKSAAEESTAARSAKTPAAKVALSVATDAATWPASPRSSGQDQPERQKR
eukprot:TRINITY_DN9622_c0_g1_i2.p1 TRINITY_DN9622_c0_g1~~TRINITY_DN9622_c0_g1_i2.p1  ORF type:complete len:215 (+),score=34.57 TRINITY_DN9622_c0_g1_i2:59-646(+)